MSLPEGDAFMELAFVKGILLFHALLYQIAFVIQNKNEVKYKNKNKINRYYKN